MRLQRGVGLVGSLVLRYSIPPPCYPRRYVVATDGETGRGLDEQKKNYVVYGEKRNERPNVGGVL